jgi:hypothetical protein
MKKVILFVIVFSLLLLNIYPIMQLNTQHQHKEINKFKYEENKTNKKQTCVHTVDSAINKIIAPQHRAVIKAMVYVESGGDTLAVSGTGDYGILQVNKHWWGNKYDFSRMNELEYGLQSGYDIFKIYYKIADGNIRETLKRYNGSYSYADKVINVMKNKLG